MKVKKSWVRFLLFIPLLLVLSTQPAFAQDDILDEIEAELKKEEEQKKAQDKADKNKEKYEKLYQTTIRKGDALLRAKKFDEAISAFTEAKKYAPSESYPDDQIALAKQEKKRNEEAEKENEVKEKYNSAITKADAYFKGQKYKEAIGAYQEASSIKSDEVYPKDQIGEAKKLIAKKEEEDKKAAASAQVEKEYSAAMSKGDAAMKAKDYNGAIAAYEAAIKIKPSDTEPKSRKTTAEKMKADEVKKLEQEATQKKYDDLISAADALLKTSDFDQAKGKYEEASKVLPHETYPKTKMKECDDSKLAAAQAKERAAYNDLIKEADALVKAESFDQAIAKYQEATKVMPHENHPKDMITQVENLKKQKADNEVLVNYEKVLKEAEELIAAEKFDEGIVKLGEAHKIMPHETKTKELISEAERLKADQANKIKNDEYEAKLKEGEDLLHAEKFDEAIVSLQAAKKMMPNDHKAQSLIDQANSLKAGKKQAATQSQFDEKIKAGEEFLKDNRFDEAIAAFEEAQRILPNDHKPATLITQTNSLRKAKENEIAKAEYDELLTTGDGQLEEGKFDEARESFKSALKAYSEGQSTVDARIAKVDFAKKLKQDADKDEADKQAKQDQFDKMIGETDALIASKDYSGAKQKIAGALLLFPSDANAKSKKAEIDTLMAEAEKEKQEKLAADAAAKDLADKEAQVKDFLTQAESKKNSGELQAAKSLISSALTVMPENEDAKTALSDIETAIEENDKKLAADLAAKKEEEKAEADKKATIDALLSEGNSLLSSGSFTESISKYDEVLELDAGNATALSKKGEAQKAKEKKEQENMAAEEKEKAAQAKKEKIESLSAEAQSEEASENYDGAIAKWNEVLSVDASNSTASSNVSRLQNKKLEIAATALATKEAAALKKVEEEKRLAAMDAEKAEAERQSKITGLSAEATSAESANNFDEAIKKWNEVLAIESTNAEATKGITRSENKKKEVAAALLAADAAEKLKLEENAKKLASENAEKAEAEKQNKIVALSSEAKSAENSNDFDGAIAKWNEVLALESSNTEASNGITRVEGKKKDATAALAAASAAEKLKLEEDAKKLASENAEKAEAEKQSKIAALSTEAKSAENSNDFDGAISKWNEILAIESTNTDAASGITRVEGKKKDAATALATANTAEKLKQEEAAKKLAAENAEKAEAEKQSKIASLSSEAKSAESSNDFDGAIEKWNEVLALESTNTDAANGITRVEGKKKTAANALTAANAAEKKKLDAAAKKQAEQEKAAKIQLLSADAQKAESSNDIDLAISKWNEVAALDASSTLATGNVTRLKAKKQKNESDKLAADEAKRKKDEEAAKAQSEKEKRNMIASYLEIGDQILAEKQYQRAIENYEKAEKLDPENLQVKSKLNRAKELKASEDKHIAQLEAAEKQQEINLLLSDAKLLAIKRQYLDAKSKYDKVLSLEPGNQRAKDGIATIQVYLDQISKREAEEDARKKARAEVLRKVEVILDDGADLFAGGQYKKAIEKYKEGIQLDPLNNELKSSIRNSKQALERKEQYRIAKLHNLPRPKPKGFKTESIGTGERKDKIEFQNALGKAYPEGVTEEKKEEKRKDVTRRVVVKDGVGSEYFKVHHDWGGIYYFHDGESIDPYKWQYGTRNPDQISNP